MRVPQLYLRGTSFPCTGAKERGASFVEFVIVFPFLFLLVFGAIEFSRMMRLQETMTTLTREAAKTVFRKCLAGDEMCGGGTETEICMNEELGVLLGVSQNMLGNAFARVAVFKYELQGSPPVPVIIQEAELRIPLPPAPPTPDPFPTAPKIQAAAFPSELMSAIQQNNRLVTAEIWWRYEPIMSFAGAYDRMFYNVSIH